MTLPRPFPSYRPFLEEVVCKLVNVLSLMSGPYLAKYGDSLIGVEGQWEVCARAAPLPNNFIERRREPGAIY